jgi:hypothetical protein
MPIMPSESRHLSETIERSAADVYEFVSDPANIPRWAQGLSTAVENVDGRWLLGTGSDRASVAFAERNAFGVVDHEVTLPSGEIVHVPMRVVPNGDGCDVVLTVRRQPDMTDADFDRDSGLVQADLTRLKRVLEGTD